MELEVKLTGILNLYVMDQGEDHSGVGTQVAPRVMAHNHQHLFSLRVDPMIDGLQNSLYETNVTRLPQPTGSPENFAGNGFMYQKDLLGDTEAALRKYEAALGRSGSFSLPLLTETKLMAPVSLDDCKSGQAALRVRCARRLQDHVQGHAA